MQFSWKILIISLIFFGVSTANAGLVATLSDVGYFGTLEDGSFNGPYSPSSAGSLAGQWDPGGWKSVKYLDAVDTQVAFEFNVGSQTAKLAGATGLSSIVFSFQANDISHTSFSSCFNLSDCPAPDVLELYGYIGDGVLSEMDYSVGDLLAEFDLLVQINQLISVDVTDWVLGLMAADTDHVGFNLRTNMSGGGWIPEGQLTLTYKELPLPPTLALLAIGMLFMVYRRNS